MPLNLPNVNDLSQFFYCWKVREICYKMYVTILTTPETHGTFFITHGVLTVAGQKVFAHKAIVSARCDVMAAMFDGHFVEAASSTAEVTYHCFLTDFPQCGALRFMDGEISWVSVWVTDFSLNDISGLRRPKNVKFGTMLASLVRG